MDLSRPAECQQDNSAQYDQDTVSILTSPCLGASAVNYGLSEDQQLLAAAKVPSNCYRSLCYSDNQMSNFSSSSQTDLIFHGNYNNNSNRESREISPRVSVSKKMRAAPTAGHKGNIEATLEGKSLWDEFCQRGTEMIVNRAGRRMFPGFSVAIKFLKPKTKYSMKLEVVLADNHRFKFLNSRWLAVGSAEPQPLSESYLHPDSPNSGAFWMRHGVSFRKLKITNNKERPGNNALLYSMHKYFLRLVVEEERKCLPGEDKSTPKVILQADYPETTFVAVTAYQNEEVTQLKITNNPFAKAFRENTGDMDWETAYSGQNAFPPLPQQQISSGCWPFASPTTPVVASLPQLSPLSGFITSSTACSVGYLPTTPQVPYYTSATPPVTTFFQWPPHSSSQRHDLVHSPYYKIGLPAELYSSSASVANLPDFETVFTTSSS